MPKLTKLFYSKQTCIGKVDPNFVCFQPSAVQNFWTVQFFILYLVLWWRQNLALWTTIVLKADCHEIIYSGGSKLSRQNSLSSFVTCTNQQSTSSRTECILDSTPCSFAPSARYFAPFISLFFFFFEWIRDVTVYLLYKANQNLLCMICQVFDVNIDFLSCRNLIHFE